MSDDRASQPVGARIAFEVSSERGCVVLTLADGAVLHVHPIIVDVMRTGIDEAGEASYVIAGGLAIRLMQGPKEDK